MRSVLAALLAFATTFFGSPGAAYAVSLACAGGEPPGFLYRVDDWRSQYGWGLYDWGTVADDGSMALVVSFQYDSQITGIFSGSESFYHGGLRLESTSPAFAGGLARSPRVSGDGTTVVGQVEERRATWARYPAYWRPALTGSRATQLPRHPGLISSHHGDVTAVSYDGRYVLGWGSFPNPPSANPLSDLLYWDVEAGTVEQLSPYFGTTPVALSADGRVIAAHAGGAALRIAIDPQGAVQVQTIAVPPIPSGDGVYTHEVTAMSADGRILAGTTRTQRPGSTSPYQTGWIWTPERGAWLLQEVSGVQGEPRSLPAHVLDRFVIAHISVNHASTSSPQFAVGIDPEMAALGPIPIADLIEQHYGVELAPHIRHPRVLAVSPNLAPVPGGPVGQGSGAYLFVSGNEVDRSRLMFAKIKLPACPDSDRDGLCNEWEYAKGIDLNGDGVIDPQNDLVLANADPFRKDLYVEVDATIGAHFDPDGLDDVVRAFAEVPNALLGNPNGKDGIALHLEFDEFIFYEGDFQPETACEPVSPTFRNQRRLYFGTEQQRAADPAVLAAKQQVYRYALFGTRFPAGDAGGVADLPGNDLLVMLEDYDPNLPLRHVTAGVFMHELGHTLGLGHGGVGPGGQADNVNQKPNYPSVMNYEWTVPFKFGSLRLADLAFTASWRLDFSRAAWPTLDENALYEANGLGGPPFRVARIGPPDGRVVHTHGAIDFDENGQIAEVPVAEDLNDLDLAKPPTPGQVLLGSNDWAFVARNFCTAMRSPDWESANVDPCAVASVAGARSTERCGLSPEEVDRMSSAEFTMDCNGNGIDDQLELEQGLAVDADGNGILDECEGLRGDVDGDGVRDEADYLAIQERLGAGLGDEAYLPAADIDGDGILTADDLGLWRELVYGPTECNDGIDNDGDGLVDYPNDPDCASPWAASESPPPAPACGHGPELVLAIPLLRWLRRRRARA